MNDPVAMTVRFLSEEWLAETDALLATIKPLDRRVIIGYQVLEGPHGPSAHKMILGPAKVGAQRGLDGANVTLTMDWPLAMAINRGQQSAQRAFLDGQISVDGDLTVLLGRQNALSQIDDRLAGLRARTTYE